MREVATFSGVGGLSWIEASVALVARGAKSQPCGPTFPTQPRPGCHFDGATTCFVPGPREFEAGGVFHFVAGRCSPQRYSSSVLEWETVALRLLGILFMPSCRAVDQSVVVGCAGYLLCASIILASTFVDIIAQMGAFPAVVIVGRVRRGGYPAAVVTFAWGGVATLVGFDKRQPSAAGRRRPDSRRLVIVVVPTASSSVCRRNRQRSSAPSWSRRCSPSSPIGRRLASFGCRRRRHTAIDVVIRRSGRALLMIPSLFGRRLVVARCRGGGRCHGQEPRREQMEDEGAPVIRTDLIPEPAPAEGALGEASPVPRLGPQIDP